MGKVLFDTNVLLDIALMRQPHFTVSAKAFARVDQIEIQGFVTASTITDIYYIAKKDRGQKLALDFITALLSIIDVIEINKATIIGALESNLKDFEDAIQVTAARSQKMDVIVTRNKADFQGAPIEVLSPSEFLAHP